MGKSLEKSTALAPKDKFASNQACLSPPPPLLRTQSSLSESVPMGAGRKRFFDAHAFCLAGSAVLSYLCATKMNCVGSFSF